MEMAARRTRSQLRASCEDLRLSAASRGHGGDGHWNLRAQGAGEVIEILKWAKQPASL